MDESVPEYRKFKTPDEIVAWFRRIKERSSVLAGKKVDTVNLVVNFCEDDRMEDFYCVGASDGDEEVEELVEDLFDFSLKGYSIWSFGLSGSKEPEFKLYLKKSRDHSTNVTPDVMDALASLLKGREGA